jgi:hypothetical protein
MFVLQWGHLLLDWICASQSADFPVSPNVCGATAFGETGKSDDWRKQKAVRRSQQ